MKIKKFKNFQLNEGQQQAWGGGPFNGASATGLTGGAPQQPNDPQLTTDAFDRMKSNTMNAQYRLAQITQNVFKTGGINKAAETMKLDKLKVLGIQKNSSGGIDLLIEFKFDDYEEVSFGKFTNWGAYNNISFKSNFLGQSTVFNKKIEAIIKKALQKWFQPEIGEYRLIYPMVRIYDNMGTVYELKEGARVKVMNVQLENEKPMIHMKVGKNWRYLTDLDYWFFNWWFEKIPEKKASS